jgi:hypothetical protein
MPMPKVVDDTGYFFNGKIPALALIANGVRLPAGTWMRIADPLALPQDVEHALRDMLPALDGQVITSVTLTSDADVDEFEMSVPRAGLARETD